MIKYRAWLHDTQAMAAVHSIHFNTGRIIVSWRRADGHAGGNQSIEKDNYTLMRFTGFYDDGEKEIYENDILQISYYSFAQTGKIESSYNYLVSWDDNIGKWNMMNRDTNYVIGQKIIGNIYENPDLKNQNLLGMPIQ